jgi:hypothetical protein
MAPSATESHPFTSVSNKSGGTKPWLKATGALDQYEHFDTTPVVGREYPHAKLAEWIQSPNSDDLLRELALIGMWSTPFPYIDADAGCSS